MGNEYKPPSRQHPRQSGDDYSYDWERSIFSVTADDFRDLADSDFGDPPQVLTRPSARLPTVDEFDFEEACAAKDLARRFGPPASNRAANRRRWSFSGRPNQLDPVRSASQKRRGRGRGIIWGLCTSILIIMISPVLFGIVQPFGDLPFGSFGNQPGNVADGQGAGTGAPARSSEPEQTAANGIEATERGADVADDDAQSNPVGVVAAEGNSDVTENSADIAEGSAEPDVVEIPTRPATAGMALAFAAPADTVVANQDGSTIAERSNTPEPPFDPVATVLEPRPIELARPLTGPAAVSEPADDAKPAIIAADDAKPAIVAADDERPKPVIVPVDTDSPRRIAQSQEPPIVDPPIVDPPVEEETASIPDKSDEPPSDARQPAGSSLTPEQIDQLLERAGELLRRGDIASSRLLYLRIADAGDRRGAKGVGMTYDPRVYARLAVTGVTPDLQEAEAWYEKAGDDLAFTVDLTPETAEIDTSETEEEGSFDRDAACARKYRSYEPSTGLYTSYGGAKKPCRLP